jgi:YhcH/YjgK/YiaL family protein
MMKTAGKYFLLIIIISTVSCRERRLPQNGDWTLNTASKWVEHNSWRKGMMLTLHPSTNLVEFARQYNKNPALWNAAFAYMKNNKLDTLSVGKHEIAGEMLFASVTDGPSKELEKANWESHKKYIDLQYVIRGKERIGVAPAAGALVTKQYDEAKDVMNYSISEGLYYVAEPEMFFLFFPSDAHRPNIKVEGFDTVKKIVLKIRVQD